jgi:DNA-binding NtrC family response regulator
LLQEKSIERLGGRETIPVDVRILAATNRNLEHAIDGGRFRQDLYYRLKVVTITLPPLKDRAEDIPLLTDFFLRRFSAELEIDNPGITDGALALLALHPWTGNIRELANTIQKALIFNRGTPIAETDLRQTAGALSGMAPDVDEDCDGAIRQWAQEILRRNAQKNLFENCINRVSGVLIGEALRMTGGNRSRAAKLLGLSRPTLHAKIEKHHLRIETTVARKPA